MKRFHSSKDMCIRATMNLRIGLPSGKQQLCNRNSETKQLIDPHSNATSCGMVAPSFLKTKVHKTKNGVT